MNNKVKELVELKDIVHKFQANGKKIAFTNGCFDLLHVGHTRYLYKASQLGDLLIVAVNSDKSVRGLKGPTRPIRKEEDRIELVAALEMVDYVLLFDELTCSSVLSQIKPDIYVKGGDYNPENLPEWPVVNEYGGEVKFIEIIKGKATSTIIQKIKGVK